MQPELSALIPLALFTPMLRTPASVAVSPKARKQQSSQTGVLHGTLEAPIALHHVPEAALLENTHFCTSMVSQELLENTQACLA